MFSTRAHVNDEVDLHDHTSRPYYVHPVSTYLAKTMMKDIYDHTTASIAVHA